MKTLLYIPFLISATVVFGQTADTLSSPDKTIKRYVAGDRIIQCNECSTDFCGNLINASGDTVALNTRPLNSSGNPIYLTKNNILLSAETAKRVVVSKNVKSLTVVKCNNGRQVFGDIAKNGIIILELTPDKADTITLKEYLSTRLKRRLSDTSIVYINGLLTTGDSLKVSKNDFFQVYYDAKMNSYNLITE